MGYRSLVIALALLCLATTDKISMQVGETRIVSLFANSDILVSKKGVVKVTFISDNLFEIIALRPGVVLVQTRKGDSKVLITVDKAGKQIRVCQQQQVSCSKNSIRGITGDLSLFLEAHANCRKNCLFDLTLTKKTAQLWLANTQRLLGDQFSLTLHGNQLIARTFCRQTKLTRTLADNLTGGYLSQGIMRLICTNHSESLQYQLTAKIALIKETKTKEQGVDSSKIWQQLDKLTDHLRWQKLTQQLQVISEPNFSLINGLPARFETGGELGYLQSDKHGNSNRSWKFYGLSLEVSVEKITDEQAQLTIDFSLKNPASNSSFNSSRFSSTVILTLGKSRAVAVIGYHNQFSADDTLPIVNKLPILGPLFNNRKRQTAVNKIIIWFLLNYDDYANEDRRRQFNGSGLSNDFDQTLKSQQ